MEFPAGKGNCQISAAGTTFVNSLTIDNGYKKEVKVSGGILAVANGGSIADGTVRVDVGKTVQFNGGNFSYSGGNFTGSGIVEIDGGTFAITGSAFGFSQQLKIQGNVDGPAKATISGMQNDLLFAGGVYVSGTLDVTQQSTITLQGPADNPAKIFVDDSGSFTYDTPATINSELTLTANGLEYFKQGTFHITTKDTTSARSMNANAGHVEFNTGARLSCDFGSDFNGAALVAFGNGTAWITGYVGFHSGGIWMAGSGSLWAEFSITGDFTMDGGTLHIDVDANQGRNNGISVSGTATLGGTSALAVDTLGTPPNPSTFDIMTAANIIGDFGLPPTFNGVAYTTGKSHNNTEYDLFFSLAGR